VREQGAQALALCAGTGIAGKPNETELAEVEFILQFTGLAPIYY
jgi:hypothetical protein